MGKITKIAFINYSLGLGGIETLILDISKRLDKELFEPAVFIFEKDGKLKNEFSNSKIPIFEIEKNKGIDCFLPIRLSKILTKQNIDIVHTHNQSSWLYGGIAAWLANIPLIHTEHTTVDYYPKHIKRWMKIEWFLSKITNKITTVSNSVANFMIGKEHISSRKIQVIYNGIKSVVYQHQIDTQLKKDELGIDNSDLIIGNVARLFPNKGHEILLKAFKIVTQKVPLAKLLITGEGPLKSELLKLVDELKLNGKVIFLGNRRDIPELLQVFDLFVLSSIREGFPIVILEAMASGLPVVATDVDGNAESVVHDKTGIVVLPKSPDKMAEGILKIVQNAELAKEMGEAGRKRVKENFDLSETVSNYQRLYKHCLKKKVNS